MSNDSKIWVCYGSTGEYSDHREWFVRAFADEARGRDFTQKVSALARQAITKYKTRFDIPEGANPLDLKMEVDYTGTNYYLVEVPFEP